MLRLAVYFVVTLVVLSLLQHVPFVGAIFRVPLLGFWGAAILVALGASKLAAWGIDSARLRRQRRDLGHVDTPRNQGKLGALLLAAGRARAAIAPLERAVQGEPETLEWRYRLGLARLAVGAAAAAALELEQVAERAEEYAYGGVQLALADAHSRSGAPAEALAAVQIFERNHGPSPESAYRRGRALRALGRRDESRAAFAEVGALASRASGLQKDGARRWALKAFGARWL